ncbi:MAG: peptide chain release factor N(5)-glutamine methyltransferase [Candidatus Kerfeldbacteria bacterium]|nr:peptide chain release factor N(5)-glutamine methyltransferase [Candidatus Kerfeldbacteria bacterium]
MTVGQALTFGSHALRSGDEPHLDAEVLLAHSIGADRSWVLAHPTTPLTVARERRFRALVAERRRGLPIAYLTGVKEFYGRAFRVTKATLIPRPESELLVEAALQRLPTKMNVTVADVGTGSGCLAITVAAERPTVRIIAVDRSDAALAVARANAHALGVASRVRFVQGDLLTPLRTPAALMLANLPYLTDRQANAASLRAEPRAALAAGSDGLAAYRRVFAQLAVHPTPPPVLLCEIGPGLVSGFRHLARSAAYTVEIQRDLAGRPRLAIATASRSSRSSGPRSRRPAGRPQQSRSGRQAR